MILFQTLRYLWTKVHRGGGVENSQAPVGMVLCARSPLLLDKDPTNCVQHTLQSPNIKLRASARQKTGESAKNSRPQRTSRDHGEWIKFSGRR